MTERLFKVMARGSSVATEAMGGLTTFLTMVYIVTINPTMLASAGMPFSAALTATCLGAAIMTLAMGLVANRPLALASGLSTSTVLVYGICLGQGVDWRVGMACVMLEGLLILVLVAFGVREAILKAIPVDLRRAISIGLGLLLAFIGLKGGGIVVASDSTFVTMGDLAEPTAIVALVSLALAVVLHARHVRGDFIISILVATVVGIPLGVTKLPSEWAFSLDLSAFAAPFQVTPQGSMAILQVFAQPMLLLFVLSMLISDFFDTMGVVLAVGQKGGFVDGRGDVLDLRTMLTVDSVAAALGGFIGASSVTSYVESASGAAAGARTGLSNVFVAALFLACAFFSPVVGMVPEAATCGALVVVGFLVMCDVAKIAWGDMTVAFPAFLTIIAIPLTYSIPNGIALGFISYCVVMTCVGRIREVGTLMWVTSAVFLATFVLTFALS
jgi:AGZA family xanthine/uracil permease-like MFS transporter